MNEKGMTLYELYEYYKKKYEESKEIIRTLQDLCGESDAENARIRRIIIYEER